MKVSVITPFFNAERFLEETIESVFAQTYPHWELLLIDDGATDGSTALARCYAEKFPGQVCYLEHEGHQNLGKSTSRNVGIWRATGEYLTFLDADDVLLPQKLERQVAILETRPELGMVYGRTQYWYGWTGQPQDSRRDYIGKLGTPPDTVFEPPVLLTQFLGDGGMVPCLCALVARRDLVLEVGGYDESIQHLYEDQVFLAKMCLAAPVYTEDGCGERYRQHPDSSSAQAIQSGAYNPFWPNEARLAYLNWLTHYIKERGISDNALQKALARSFRPYNHPYLYRFITPLSYFWMHTRGYLDFMISIAKKILVPKPNLGTRKQPSDSSTKRPAGTVDFGNLRRVQPVSREFGYDRGLPIDRYYIEKFLAAHQQDICGRVLEIGDDSYTRHFGGERVTTRDVLHVAAGDPAATFVGDLTQAEHIPSAAFDCFILTQTLHLIYDVRKALQTIYRILKPGGVVLATFPGISQISSDRWANNWHWSFTTLSARRLFEEVFPDSGITMEVYGNVLTATAFLQGLAVEELSQAELDYQDPNYEFLITIRAQKPR